VQERSLLGPLKVLYAEVGRLFHVPLPSFHPYVVGGPDANRRVLITARDKLLWKNPDPVTDLLRQGVLVTDGAEHDLYRRLMEPPLQPARLPEYAASMIRHVDRVSATWQDGQVVDMLVEARKIALLIIMDILFGVDAWGDLSRIWRPILKAIAFISPGIWILWRRVPRPGYRRALAQLDAYLFGIIAERRAQGKLRADLLQHLIDAGLDDDRIRDQMLTMLIAGHDTSTALLAWVFYLLGTHTKYMQQLTAELDDALGRGASMSSAGWQPRLLDHIIKEALRLYPPIHIGNRMVAEDIELEHQRIPQGERLLYSIYLTHRDPEFWDDPDSFCPERFAAPGSKPPFAYVPFGGGPRSCIGAAFGQAEARVVIARLLQNHAFELVGTKIRAHMGATLEPRPGVRMRVRKRLME
jgi:cytochrome P450